MSVDKSGPLGCRCEMQDQRYVDHYVRATICPTSDSRAGRRTSDSYQKLYECEKYAFFFQVSAFCCAQPCRYDF